MGELESAAAPVSVSTGTGDRRRDVVSCAMATSSAWLVPLGGLTAVMAYLFLIFSEFAAEGLDGHITARTYVIVLGLPALLFVLASAAGLGTAWLLARWTSRQPSLTRVRPFILGACCALLGAVVAALAFYGALSGANWLAARD